MVLVSSKAECLKLYKSGKFGNYGVDWTTPQKAREDGFKGLVMLRSKKPASLWCAPNLSLDEAESRIEDAVSLGEDRNQFYVSAMLSDQESHTTIQGEVFRSPLGLTLNYTTSPKPMRLALREQSLHAHGAAAHYILRSYLDWDSYDQLIQMIDNDYSELCNNGWPTSHVVEFTTFDCPVGVNADNLRNTMFWEVRAY